MTNIDARIRKYLDDVDEAFGDDETGANDALRAVLDQIANAEEFGDDIDLDDIRTTIARALGVTK